jgi:hypothetical protein
MAADGLRYDRMVEDALRGVVRDSLIYAAEHGLPDEHHFYVTFRTRHPGTAIPDHLKARHPDEMTIVLQHQFWDLDVTRDRFAVTGFADPSAKFGLQFQGIPGATDDDIDADEPEAPFAAGPAPVEPKGDGDGDGDDSGGDGKVVTLDRFRKK